MQLTHLLLYAGALLVLPNVGAGQALVLKNNEPMFILDQSQAANVDYWARKGLAAEPLVNSLELEVKLLGDKISLHELMLRNSQTLLSSCAADNERLGKENANLQTRTRKLEDDLMIYKEKNQRKGQIIAVGAGILAIAAYIGITSAL